MFQRLLNAKPDKYNCNGILIGIIFILLLGGCSSGPQLAKYPRSHIDRPFTLPKGVASWEIPAVTSYSKWSSDYDRFMPPIPVPLVWQTSLSDNWQLTWAPLPLAISHQIKHDSGYFGTYIRLRGGYSLMHGVLLAPSIGAKYRKKLTSKFALDIQENFIPQVWLSGGPFDWQNDFLILALYQFHPLMALSAGPDLNFSKKISFSYDSLSHFTTIRTTIPLIANFQWSFHRQWDFDLSYRLNSIGQSDGVYSHTGIIAFKHFW